jgi:hypothetical protein
VSGQNKKPCSSSAGRGGPSGQACLKQSGQLGAPLRSQPAWRRGTGRPGDLIEAINTQASDGYRIAWKILNDTLRRLKRSSYVARQEMPGVPRETRYRLRPPRRRPGLRAQPARLLV